MRHVTTSALAVLLLASTTRPARGQSSVVGSLGIASLECDCTFDGRNPNARGFRFRSNPVILEIADGGPSDGLLWPGDTIFDVDSRSLRSLTGGMRFANIRPGQTATLGIRRGGRTLHVAITAVGVRSDDPSGLGEYSPVAPGGWDRRYGPPRTPRVPTPPAAMLPPRAPGAPSTPRPATPPIPPGVPDSPASPRGWFGFSIRCNDCGWSRNGNEPYPRWESTTAPEISLIAPGSPADRAGFKTGDYITHVDGFSILQPEGSRRFGMLKPGQRVRLTVSRNGQSITRDLTLAQRPGFGSRRNTLRYTGRVSNVDVEVWSPQAATVQREGDTITISVGASTIRVKATR
jgi:hypothetical protein